MIKEVIRIDKATLKKNGITYLENLSLRVNEGDIMGLLCINYHGLNELVELICNNGILQYGRIYFEEQLVNSYIGLTEDVNNTDIIRKTSYISYKSQLIDTLTVTDNIFVLRNGFRKYVINNSKLYKEVNKTFKELGINIRPDVKVGELSIFERRVVELVKSVMAGSRLIIINSLQNILGYVDSLKFYEIIKYYSDKGISFIYIGNHHEELFRISTCCCIFENGRIIKYIYKEDMKEENIIPFVLPILENKNVQNKKRVPILEFKNIGFRSIKALSFKIYKNECITIFDKTNSSISDILKLLEVKDINYIGNILVDGKRVRTKGELYNILNRVAVICENPIGSMIFYNQNYMFNLSFLIDRKVHSVLNIIKYEKSLRKEFKKELGEVMEEKYLETLAPKDLYTLVYYRIMIMKPRVVFIINPFTGADHFLRVHIANLIKRLNKENISVVIITSQITDSLAITEQLIVLEDGRTRREDSIEEEPYISDNYYRNRYFEKLHEKSKE